MLGGNIMLSLPHYPSTLFYAMSEIHEISTGGGNAVGGDATVDRDYIGRDRSNYDSNVNINFDRASNWDPEREELTPLQRIRDLETHVYGDRRGFIIGILHQMRSHVTWLIILSLLQFVVLVMLAILISISMRGA